jgi:hypothetical protein
MPYPTQHENFYKNQVIQLQFQLEHLTEIYNNRINDRIISEGILARIIGAAAGGVERAAVRVGERFPSAVAETGKAAAAAAAAARVAANRWRTLTHTIRNIARDIPGPELRGWINGLDADQLRAYNYMFSETRDFIHNGQTYIQRMYQGRVEFWDPILGDWSTDLSRFGFDVSSGATPSAFGGLNAEGRLLHKARNYVEADPVDLTDLPNQYIGITSTQNRPTQVGSNPSFPNRGY